MNTAEARQLAGMIHDSWPSMRIAPQIWEEELTELDPGRAGTAYIRLRRESTHAPSIADFHGIYRSLHTERPKGLHCGVCGGDGWESFTFTRNNVTYPGVKPCRCTNGRANDKLHAEIVSTRDTKDRGAA